MKKRIVRDGYAGFEVQVKYFRFLPWVQYGGTNTHSFIERARKYAQSGDVVEYL